MHFYNEIPIKPVPPIKLIPMKPVCTIGEKIKLTVNTEFGREPSQARENQVCDANKDAVLTLLNWISEHLYCPCCHKDGISEAFEKIAKLKRTDAQELTIKLVIESDGDGENVWSVMNGTIYNYDSKGENTLASFDCHLHS